MMVSIYHKQFILMIFYTGQMSDSKTSPTFANTDTLFGRNIGVPFSNPPLYWSTIEHFTTRL